MGFFSRVFGSSSPSPSSDMTAEQMGSALFQIVLERVRDHHAQLQELNLVSSPAPAPTVQYLMGLTTFVLAPLEQALSDLPFPQVRAVKSAVRAAFIKEFKIRSPAEFTPALDTLMRAYAQMARAGDLITLGARAAESIGLDGNVDAETFLVGSYTSSLNF
jgi:hypothetical protein